MIAAVFGVTMATLLVFILWTISTEDERRRRLPDALAKIEGRKPQESDEIPR